MIKRDSNDDLSKPGKLITMPKPKAIYLGCQMKDKALIEVIHKICFGVQIPLYQAKKDTKSYCFNFERLENMFENRVKDMI